MQQQMWKVIRYGGRQSSKSDQTSFDLLKSDQGYH